MNKEEAIRIFRKEIECLSHAKCEDCILEKACDPAKTTPFDSEYIEAYSMAIQALSQEPCDDIAQERYKDLCEYFGGAKDILKSREDFKAWLGRVKWHIRKAEELYEKYEYKKEPCEDYEDDGWIDDEYGRSIRLEQNKTEVIPPLEPCDDTISRDNVEECKELMTDINGDTVYAVRMSDIRQLPSVTQKPTEGDDTVSRGVFEQVMGERDIAIEQLHELGYEWGQKIVLKQKSGKWISRPHIYGVAFCSECGYELKINNTNYCPNCGCRMVEPQGQESEE